MKPKPDHRTRTVALRAVWARSAALALALLHGCGGGDGPIDVALQPVGQAASAAPAAGGVIPAADAASAAPSAPTAPPLQIRRQPRGADVYEGAIAEFSVDAQGPGPLSYQWLRDDEAIDGETGPRLRLPVTAADDRVRISVLVRAGAATLHSAAAVLRVGRS